MEEYYEAFDVFCMVDDMDEFVEYIDGIDDAIKGGNTYKKIYVDTFVNR